MTSTSVIDVTAKVAGAKRKLSDSSARVTSAAAAKRQKNNQKTNSLDATQDALLKGTLGFLIHPNFRIKHKHVFYRRFQNRKQLMKSLKSNVLPAGQYAKTDKFGRFTPTIGKDNVVYIDYIDTITTTIKQNKITFETKRARKKETVSNSTTSIGTSQN